MSRKIFFKYLSLIIILLASGSIIHAQTSIFISDSTVFPLNISGAITYYSSAGDSIQLEDLSNAEIRSKFIKTSKEDLNLGFTTSTIWCHLKINNTSTLNFLILEVGRAITNEIQVYDAINKDWIGEPIGDDYAYENKQFPHRLNLVKLPIAFNENEFYIKLKSDGEVVKLILNAHTFQSIWLKDYRYQFILGLFYGLLGIILISNLYFYFTLKERVFLIYSIYVSSIFFLQLSLDGLTFELLFQNQPFLANNSVILFASSSIFFIFYYARYYLDLKTKLPLLNKILKIGMLIAFIVGLTALLPNSYLKLSYPIINIVGFLGLILLAIGIIYFQIKKEKIDIYFLLAILSLILGSVFFILSNSALIKSNFLFDHSLRMGNGLEALLLSFSISHRYSRIQRERNEAKTNELASLQEINILKDRINSKLEKEVEDRTFELKKQNDIIIKKNTDITDGLLYAQKLQNTVYQDIKDIRNNLSDILVIHLPKDIVSGDFHWHNIKPNNKVQIGIADCTGHGVAGAFMSMLGIVTLNNITQDSTINCDEVLSQLNDCITKILDPTHKIETQHFGMDIAFLEIDHNNKKINFCSANRPIILVQDTNKDLDEVLTFKPTKRGIGASSLNENPFLLQEIPYISGSWIYMYTDGLTDQFGGERGKKLLRVGQMKWLKEASKLTGEQQEMFLLNKINLWMAKEEQIDDICLIGIRIA